MKELDKKWLRRDGDQNFLFNVQGEGKKNIVVDCIPKVCEFADVFSEELPGLLPHREMDFSSIEVYPGTDPI